MKRFLNICLFLCSLVGCTRITDIAPEGVPRVVVECVLTEDDVQQLRLSMTDIATQKELAVLQEAEVVIIARGDGVYREYVFEYIGDDIWEAEFRALPGHYYKVEIDIPGYERIEAETVMPDAFGILYDLTDPLYKLWDVFSYMRQTSSSTSLSPGTVVEAGIMFPIDSLPKAPVWIYGMNYDAVSGEYVIAENIATSLSDVDRFNLAGGTYHSDGDISPPTEYIDDLVFTMYDSVEGKPLHSRYLRLPPLYDGLRSDAEGCEDFQVAGSFKEGRFWMYEPEHGDGFIGFMAVSHEYDRFLKEIIAMTSGRMESTDYADIFSRENVYTNIRGGAGIFGAKTQYQTPWNNHVLFSPLSGE